MTEQQRGPSTMSNLDELRDRLIEYAPAPMVDQMYAAARRAEALENDELLDSALLDSVYAWGERLEHRMQRVRDFRAALSATAESEDGNG